VTGAQIGPNISSVPNSALTNSSMTIAGTSVSLGGSITQATICSGYATTSSLSSYATTSSLSSYAPLASPTFSGTTTFPGSTVVNSNGGISIGGTATVRGITAGFVPYIAAASGTVNFGFTFANPPYVVASISEANSTTVYCIQIGTVTTTSFTYSKTLRDNGNNGALAASQPFYWIAVGL
jgi:hypothetical protein